MNIKPILFTKDTDQIEYLNRLYRFYKATWTNTFKELKSNKNNLSEDFFRFDIKAGLFNGNEALGFHGYQFFDLDRISDREHPYLNQTKEPIVQTLIENNLTKIASLEYLCASPKLRKSQSHISFGEVIIGFSVNYLKRFDLDGVIGITRNNRSVNKSAHSNGAESLLENLDLHGVKVDIVLFRPKEIKPNPNPIIEQQIDFLLSQIDSPRLRSVA